VVEHLIRNRITVTKHYGVLPHVQCYPNQLNQVFMNLLVNSAQAIDGSGEITIGTSVSNGDVLIELTDTGSGIREQDLDKIFDPGFTTKGVGVGTGLGLSIVHQIVQDHGGRIEVQSELGSGTTFRITLPVKLRDSEARASTHKRPAASQADEAVSN
jgi:signal transduction histidine kinase